MKIGYVRVSKQEQHEALQIDARHAKRAVKNGSLIRLPGRKRNAKAWTRLWPTCGKADTFVVTHLQQIEQLKQLYRLRG